MATMFLQILNVPTTMLPLGARGSETILITWNFGNMYMYIDTYIHTYVDAWMSNVALLNVRGTIWLISYNFRYFATLLALVSASN